MEKKKNLYRGKKKLDYEVPFSDKEGSNRKLKEHFQKIKRKEMGKKCNGNKDEI